MHGFLRHYNRAAKLIVTGRSISHISATFNGQRKIVSRWERSNNGSVLLMFSSALLARQCTETSFTRMGNVAGYFYKTATACEPLQQL